MVASTSKEIVTWAKPWARKFDMRNVDCSTWRTSAAILTACVNELPVPSVMDGQSNRHMGAYGATPNLEGIPEMDKLLASMRIWQKSLLPLLLCGIVAGGLSGYLISNLATTDARYGELLEKEAKAAVWAVRMNATLVNAARLTWMGIADDTSDPADDRRQVEAQATMFHDVVAQVAGRLAGTDIAARLAEHEASSLSDLTRRGSVW